MMNKNNRDKILGTIFVISLIALVGVLAFDQGIAYEKHMNESVGMDKVPFGAYMTLTVIRADGSRVLAWSGHNVLTTSGLNACREQIAGAIAAAFDYIAIGTGTGQGSGDNVLATEVFRSQGTYAVTVAGNWTITKTWAAGTFSGELITEAGCFNASSSGIMLNVQSFSAITLTSADSLEVEFEFMIAQG